MSGDAAVPQFDEETLQQTLIRWTTAAVCIVVAHAALIYAALNWPEPAVVPSDPPAAVMIELAPLPVAPDAQPQEVALGPQMVMSEAHTPSESVDTPVEPQEVAPDPPLETSKPVVQEITPEVAVDDRPLPEVRNVEVVLAQTTSSVREEKPIPEKPRPEKAKKKVERKKPKDRAAPNAPKTAAPQTVPVQRASANAAPSPGAFSSTSPANWRSAVMAHLNRHKRFPPGGSRGTATVAFTIDRSGRVLSARLVRSSGDTALDQEAVALVRRASPVPAPPANVGGGAITLGVPVRFDR